MSTQYCGCDPTHAGGPHFCERHDPAPFGVPDFLLVPKDPSGTPAMWGLSDALALIREIQPEIHALGFHVCLAGGVLNKGYSEKDLDLVFVPLTNETKGDADDITSWCFKRWGGRKDNLSDPVPCISLREQASYLTDDGKRIDVFVV
jgi:hypothetical protein